MRLTTFVAVGIISIFIGIPAEAASINPTTWAPTTSGVYFFDRSNLTGNAQADFTTRETAFGRKFDGHLYYLPCNVTNSTLADPHWSLTIDKVPFVTLSWCTGNNPTTIIPDIVAGKYDADITSFAQSVKSQLSPYGHVLIRPFWEFNYTGSEWNDVNYGNNPAEFTAAWQHFVNIFRANNVSNVKWLWNPIRIGGTSSQNPVAYYPGSSYVDWIGLDAYPKNQYLSLYQLATTSGGSTFDWYDTFKTYGKPLMFGEIGIQPANVYGAGSPTRSTWWNDTLTELKTQLPAVQGFEYFDSIGATNWTYDASGTTTGDSGSNALAAAKAVALNCYMDILSAACGNTSVTPIPSIITPTLFCLGSCPVNPSPTSAVASPTVNPSNNPTSAPTQNPCTSTTSTGTVHAFKSHKHTNGAISNLILLLLQFITKLLEQLLGISIELPTTGNPMPTQIPPSPGMPSPTIGSASISPIPSGTSPVPTANPCIGSTTTPSSTPTSLISPTAAVSKTPTIVPTKAPSGQHTSQRWDITTPSLNQLASIDPTSAKWFYNTANANVFGSAVSGYAAQPTANYKSYAMFAQALNSGTFPKGVKWVVYDNESWSLTPTNEQQHPAQYMKQFADLAHQHGLHVIETPARDLMSVSGADCTAKAGESIDQAFVRCQIPADARYADIYEIQAQADQTSVSAYTSLVKAAKGQAIGAAPNILIEAGLTTDRGDSASVIFSCWQATHTMVNGYWMNTQSATISVAAQAFDKIRAAGG